MDQPARSHASDASRGLAALACSFTLWGVFPLYLRLLRPVPPLQITAHRVLFCCILVLGFLRYRGALREVRDALADPRSRVRLIASAGCISINWLVFVWAVANDHVVDASLGYFINPLVIVVLGVVVLGERLRRLQWVAVCFAALGVAYLTWVVGSLPWIALSLALSFGSYGLLRKTVAVDAMAGLGTESLLVVPFAIGYLAFCEGSGTGAFQHGDPVLIVLLALSGLITAVPLWLFAYGTRRVPFSTVGVMQYISPTIALLLGVYVLHEPFPATRAFGFALIWGGLAIYAVDGLRHRA